MPGDKVNIHMFSFVIRLTFFQLDSISPETGELMNAIIEIPCYLKS